MRLVLHTAAYWLILIVRDAFLYTLRVWAILFGLAPGALQKHLAANGTYMLVLGLYR